MILYHDSGELEEVIPRLARKYHDKVGRWPSVCYVHRAALNGGITIRVGDNDIKIKPMSFVLKNHYQLGESDASDKKE